MFYVHNTKNQSTENIRKRMREKKLEANKSKVTDSNTHISQLFVQHKRSDGERTPHKRRTTTNESTILQLDESFVVIVQHIDMRALAAYLFCSVSLCMCIEREHKCIVLSSFKLTEALYLHTEVTWACLPTKILFRTIYWMYGCYMPPVPK